LLVESVTTLNVIAPDSTAAAEAPAKPVQPLPHFEIKELQALLQRSVEIEEPGAEPQTDAPPQAKVSRPPTVVKPGRVGTWMRRGLKAALGLALAAVLGWGPLNTLLTPASVEAVVNARVIALRSPIGGEIVVEQPLPSAGSMVAGNAVLLKVVNARADRGGLDQLQADLDMLRDEQPILAAKRDALIAAQAALTDQTDAFMTARAREVEAKVGEYQAEIAIAEAKNIDAKAALGRAEKLLAKGAMSSAERDRASRDAAVAEATLAQMRHRLEGVKVEQDAIRAGHFVGEEYNDKPSSAQQADDLKLRIAEINAEMATRDARAKRIVNEIAAEEKRYAQRTEYTLKVPADGRVWEVKTSPGEQVAAGQDLLHVLDCSAAVVTATVSESVYNHLRVGTPARFRLRDAQTEYKGEVVNLTGIAGAAANYAIEPSALIKEPYRVTVAVNGLAAGASCGIGRTGHVYFDDLSKSEGMVSSWLSR
jgi:multidrug resistance efflux pump